MNNEGYLKTMRAMEGKKRNRLEDLKNMYGSTTAYKIYDEEQRQIKEAE